MKKTKEPIGFTGQVLTVECYKHFEFMNYRIVTLNIENGNVISTKYSQPYASFEAISKLEGINDIAFKDLLETYKNGKVLDYDPTELKKLGVL